MGTTIVAPTRCTRLWHETAVFLAGGISGCEDWQGYTAARIARETPANLIVLNPRREGDMDPTHRPSATEQITWEFESLTDSDYVIFWFPEGGPCPITLFELGKELVKAQARGTANHIFIGCHPNYNRRLDVEIQLNLMFPNETIWSNLDQMTTAFISMFKD